ncbi:hypothetical protein QTP88_017380 [Uroleucon formosanum]
MSNNIMYNNPLIYGVEFQTRLLCSLHANNDQDCFLIGTQSLVTSNIQVHLVKLQEETNILCPQIYEHSYGEIWSLASSPTDKHLIYILVMLVTMFHPTNDAYMCSVIDNNIVMWDVGESGVKIVCTAFVTADDCYIKAWDLRTQTKIAWNLDGVHTKIIRYNPEHDELIGTTSSDGQVLIICLAGILSSAVEIEDMKTKISIEDKIVTTCDQLEDSVYCVEWSSVDSWILASLSYDGRLLLNKVPKDEQLRILL